MFIRLPLRTLTLSRSPSQVRPGCRSEWPTGRAPGWAAPSSCPVQWRATRRRSSCGPKTAATSTAAGAASGWCSKACASRRWRRTTLAPTSARPPTASAVSTSTTRSSSSVGSGSAQNALTRACEVFLSFVQLPHSNFKTSQHWYWCLYSTGSLVREVQPQTEWVSEMDEGGQNFFLLQLV